MRLFTASAIRARSRGNGVPEKEYEVSFVFSFQTLRHVGRFNVMEANLMVATKTASYGFDVVDLHYWMLHQIHKRMV